MIFLTEMFRKPQGVELLSSEDFVNACKMLEALKLPVRLWVFAIGVVVTELQLYREDEAMTCITLRTISERRSLTLEEVANVCPPG